MEEIYKDIPDYEGMYQVSNLGNVKSLERVVKHWRGGLKVVREKVLKGGVSSGRIQFKWKRGRLRLRES